MENKEIKPTKEQESKFWGFAMFVMFFLAIVEGTKWFHKKFGIAGDIVLVALFIYIVFLQKPKPLQGNPARTDIHFKK